MSLADALRALAEEVELWPEDERGQVEADATRHIDCTTRHLREQRKRRAR